MGSGIGLSGSSSGSLRPKTSPDNAQIRNLCKSAFDSLVAVSFKLPWCCLCSFSVCFYLVVLQGLGDRRYLTLHRDSRVSRSPKAFRTLSKRRISASVGGFRVLSLGVLGFFVRIVPSFAKLSAGCTACSGVVWGFRFWGCGLRCRLLCELCQLSRG